MRAALEEMARFKSGPCNLAVLLLCAASCIAFDGPVLVRNEKIVPVDKHLCRFDTPWRFPARVARRDAKQSRHRYLYSGVREGSGDGLGHGMATLNAEVLTALRLGLTYTHRVGKYGSLVQRGFKENVESAEGEESVAGLSKNGGRVEGFFGWGVGEIPREAVQNVACMSRDGGGGLDDCQLCLDRELGQVKKGERVGTKVGAGPRLRVDRIVEIPMELSYKFPGKADEGAKQGVERFLKRHNGSYTVFHMPHSVCGKSPTYSKFGWESRAFFFHKYWDAHGRVWAKDAKEKTERRVSWKRYRDSWAKTLKIGGVPKREKLWNLKEDELTIAVHVRRGDFFKAKRPMVSAKSFAKVVRRVVSEVEKVNGSFAGMGVKVNIYSEGMPIKGNWSVGHDWSVGHNVEQYSKVFLDSDGTLLSRGRMERLLRDESLDRVGKVFRNGLKVQLMISEDTLRSLHEMISSDLFIGSLSGMSHHLVGSLSRGAMQLFPKRFVDSNEWFGHVQFDGETGEMSESEIKLVRDYWKRFANANEESAGRAVGKYKK